MTGLRAASKQACILAAIDGVAVTFLPAFQASIRSLCTARKSYWASRLSSSALSLASFSSSCFWILACFSASLFLLAICDYIPALPSLPLNVDGSAPFDCSPRLPSQSVILNIYAAVISQAKINPASGSAVYTQHCQHSIGMRRAHFALFWLPSLLLVLHTCLEDATVQARGPFIPEVYHGIYWALPLSLHISLQTWSQE